MGGSSLKVPSVAGACGQAAEGLGDLGVGQAAADRGETGDIEVIAIYASESAAGIPAVGPTATARAGNIHAVDDVQLVSAMISRAMPV